MLGLQHNICVNTVGIEVRCLLLPKGQKGAVEWLLSQPDVRVIKSKEQNAFEVASLKKDPELISVLTPFVQKERQALRAAKLLKNQTGTPQTRSSIRSWRRVPTPSPQTDLGRTPGAKEAGPMGHRQPSSPRLDRRPSDRRAPSDTDPIASPDAEDATVTVSDRSRAATGPALDERARAVSDPLASRAAVEAGIETLLRSQERKNDAAQGNADVTETAKVRSVCVPEMQ